MWKAHHKTGCNIAVVWRTKAERDRMVEKQGLGLMYPVIDGDQTDLRFTDPKRVVVGLYAKGAAKTDTSGFVID